MYLQVLMIFTLISNLSVGKWSLKYSHLENPRSEGQILTGNPPNIFKTLKCYTFCIQSRALTSQPLHYESPPLTTRPGLLPFLFIKYLFLIFAQGPICDRLSL